VLQGGTGSEGEGEGSEWEEEEGSEEESEEDVDVVGPLGGHRQGLGGVGGKGAGLARSVRSGGGGGGSSRGSAAGGDVREGSIASSYWRDEREDRRETLDVIDQRFEHMALQYEVRRVEWVCACVRTYVRVSCVSVLAFQDLALQY